MANPEKTAAVAEITERFRTSSAGVLTEYRGLTVAQLKELRRSLGDNATYTVVKNTLTSIAAKEAGIDAFEGQLSGPTAIAFINGDPVEAAKGLRTFARANPALVIKGGYLDGNALTTDEISRLADLESREVLLAKMAGALKASLNNAAYLFAAPLSQAARTLDALRAKLAEAAPAADAPSSDAPSSDAPSSDAPSSDAAAPDAATSDAAAPDAAAGAPADAVAVDA